METIIQQMPQTEASIEETVRKVIAEKLGLEPVQFSISTNFSNELGTDSLDMMEIFMELEKRFNIIIPDEEAEKLRTLESIIGFVQINKN